MVIISNLFFLRENVILHYDNDDANEIVGFNTNCLVKIEFHFSAQRKRVFYIFALDY